MLYLTRRQVAAAAAAVVCASVLAGCSSSAAPDPQNSASYDAYPSLLTDVAAGTTVASWGWDSPEFNKPIEDYVKAVAGVTVEGRQIPVDKLVNQLQLSAQAGSLPDVFKVPSTTQLPSLVQAGVLRDITDLVEPYRAYLTDKAWESCTYEGKVYCIPGNSPAGGMFYRADVLEKYGIDPATLTTWDKYIAAAEKVNEESGGEVALFGFKDTFTGGGIPQAILNLNKAQLLDEDLNVMVSADSPEWQSTMSLIRRLLDVGKEVPEWTPQWYEAMKTGSLASYGEGTWFASTILQQAPDTLGKWTFTPYPAVEEGGDRYPSSGSAFVAISPTTDKVDAAFEVAKAWTVDPEGAIGIGLEQLGISTINTEAMDSSYVNAPDPYFANGQAYWRDAFDAYTNITYLPPVSTASDQATAIFTTDIANFIAGQSTDEFLTQLAADLRQQIKGAK